MPSFFNVIFEGSVMFYNHFVLFSSRLQESHGHLPQLTKVTVCSCQKVCTNR